MADGRKLPPWQQIVAVAGTLLIAVLLGAVLVWARTILIPLALAVLLSFLLNPLVQRLNRLGIPRVPAVVFVVGVASLLLGGLLALFISQLNSLAHDLPSYRQNIARKVAMLRGGTEGSAIEKVQETISDVAEELDEKDDGSSDKQKPRAEEPVPVTIVGADGPDRLLAGIVASFAALGPALQVLAAGALTSILVIFMLIQREDLRNRLVSFASDGGLATTTKALDDAGQRIGRYLLMQLIINGTYGLAVFLGLSLIRVPYAFLWGLFAAVFRYIPYIGPWLAALLPLSVSLMSSPGWSQVLLVMGMFVVYEILSNNVMEPWLYGHGVGISMVALIISAAFWTLLWGPPGLVLATPLTVCLVVLGKYVPALRFLDKLLGEEPDVQHHVIYLQRLMARDVTEAAAIGNAYYKEHGLGVYDGLLIPALALVRNERIQGTMTTEDEDFVEQTTAAVVARLGADDEVDATSDQATDVAAGDESAADAEASSPPAGSDERAGSAARTAESAADDVQQPVVMGVPAHHETEEVVLSMLEHILDEQGTPFEVITMRTLPSDVIARVAEVQPAVVVISTLPPGGFEQARYLCRELRKRCRNVGIIVGVWAYEGNLDKLIVKFRSAGANYVTTTLFAAQSHIQSMTRAAANGGAHGASRANSATTPPRASRRLPADATQRAPIETDSN